LQYLTCTVSGSFRRSLDQIRSKIAELEDAGFNVLSPQTTRAVRDVDGFIFFEGETGSPKEIERGHLRAIRKSDCLYVVNDGGYIGPSATLEIGYALSLGIPVFSATPPSEPILGMLVKTEPDVARMKIALLKVSAEAVPKHADLTKLQSYVQKMVHLRGFEQETLRDVMLLFVEEVGELAKAVRKRTGLKISATDAQKEVSVELADCLIYLLDLANLAEVDLDLAFREKEAINFEKQWGVDLESESHS
jgi:NTP pyrophosphatase (non-canonical NTP hydrolase)